MHHILITAALINVAICGFSQEISAEDQDNPPLTEEMQPPPRASKPPRKKLTAGYNAPDRIAVRSSWSLNADLSFLYWMPMEENLEPGVILDTSAPSLTKGEIIDFDFQYKPGLKVGLGFAMEYDNWNLSAEYTRLRSRMKMRPQLSSSEHISPIILMPQITGTNNYDSLEEKWRLTLDVIDAYLSRSYFNGTQLSFSYFFGVRGAWIYQSLINQFGSIGNSVRGTSTSNGIVDSTLTSDSWAVGPRVGLDGQWMMDRGVRLYGNGGVDLLFTRYHLSRKEFSTLLNFTYQMSEKGINTLRGHLDLELGLGWGSHFGSNRWHFDLSAGYTFQAFFNQNMFRTYYNTNSFQGEAPHGNLYIQGLTATVRVDF